MKNVRCRKALGIDLRTLHTCALSHTYAHIRRLSSALALTEISCTTLAFSLTHTHGYTHLNTHTHTYGGNRSAKPIALTADIWAAVVCRLIDHLAADDLWRKWPNRDKVSEPWTFNYRSEGSRYISMRHPSPLLLIALQVCILCVCVWV